SLRRIDVENLQRVGGVGVRDVAFDILTHRDRGEHEYDKEEANGPHGCSWQAGWGLPPVYQIMRCSQLPETIRSAAAIAVHPTRGLTPPARLTIYFCRSIPLKRHLSLGGDFPLSVFSDCCKSCMALRSSPSWVPSESICLSRRSKAVSEAGGWTLTLAGPVISTSGQASCNQSTRPLSKTSHSLWGSPAVQSSDFPETTG